MTDRYEALRKAAEAATPGPWKIVAGLRPSYSDHGYRLVATTSRGPHKIYARASNMVQPDLGCVWGDDAEFIALANPAAIQDLLAERDPLAAQVEALKANADRYRWLRDICGLVEWKSMTGSANYFLPSGRALDLAIDATRKGQP